MRQLNLFESAVLESTTAPSARSLEASAFVKSGPGGGAETMSVADLERRLDTLLDGRLLSVTLTENRSRIVSARGGRDGLDVRIHRSFLHASPQTLKRVAEFLNGARGASRRRALASIREHFEGHREAASANRRRIAIDPVGRSFDLAEIKEEINRRYFGSRLEVEISWGRMPPLRRRRRGRSRGFSVRLGTYHDQERLIRIHRALDRPGVPRYVVESVVYHEMLHAEIPPVIKPGRRRQLHPPEFRRRERQFPRYEEAEDWLAENLARLAGLE